MNKEEEKPIINTKKLIILDYLTGVVHWYDIDAKIDVTPQYIQSIGFKPDNVVYMFGDLQTREHPGILTKIE